MYYDRTEQFCALLHWDIAMNSDILLWYAELRFITHILTYSVLKIYLLGKYLGAGIPVQGWITYVKLGINILV